VRLGPSSVDYLTKKRVHADKQALLMKNDGAFIGFQVAHIFSMPYKVAGLALQTVADVELI